MTVLIRELAKNLSFSGKEERQVNEINRKRNLDLYHRLVLDSLENFRIDFMLFESLHKAVEFIVDLENTVGNKYLCLNLKVNKKFKVLK